jgi:RimK family alpha-L-glutamate ligase
MFAVVAHKDSETNLGIVGARPGGGAAARLTPSEALAVLGRGDVALGRLDVRGDVAGVEPGLWALGQLAARDVLVLNPPSTLLTAHDKLLTARELARFGVPHPRTRLLLPGDEPPALDMPVVLKPRFGSWGRDVHLCRNEAELEQALAEVSERRWFASQGALLQDLVTPRGYDLRVLVSGREVIGSIRRRAAAGEWRTNVALGGTREPTAAPCDACELALAAASAAGASLVGVDMLPVDGGWVVLELNGAVDFTPAYASGDVFASAARALERALADAPPEPEPEFLAAEA